MWQYLEHLSVYLKNLGQVLKAVAPAESEQVREGFVRSTTIVPGTRKPRGMSKTAMRSTPSASTLQNVQFVTTKDGHLLPGEQSRCYSLLMPNTRWHRTTLALHSMKINLLLYDIYTPLKITLTPWDIRLIIANYILQCHFYDLICMSM